MTTFVNLSFEHGIYSSFEIIRGCSDAEIINIYSKREDAIGAIVHAVRAMNTKLDITAIAGTDFFNVNCDVINRIDRSCQDKRNVQIRVLLLDPRSYFAVERCLIEEHVAIESPDVAGFDYPDKKLCRDILQALAQLEGILVDRKKDSQTPFQLEIRTYNEAPQFMSVRVDDEIFAEPYYKGTTQSQNRSSLTNCLGKNVPVLRTARTSNLGQILESHFDRLWKLSEKRTFQPGCLRFLELELRHKNWVVTCQERYHDTEGALEIKVHSTPGKAPQAVPAPKAKSSQAATT